MKNEGIRRRQFMGAALGTVAAAAAIAPGASTAVAAEGGGAAPGAQRQLYELRHYRLRRGPMQQKLGDYLRDGLLPALKRMRIGPVGVFNTMLGPDSPSMHVLIPHASADSFVTLGERLAADAEYVKAAEPFLKAPATDPAFASLDVSLLRAFPGMPAIEPPPRRPRIFELRVYRSHSEPAGLKKVEMFDTGGGQTSEIAIFRRVGLAPVFFAQTIAGAGMPNLVYMLTFPDLATREKNWRAFGGDPDWRKLSSTPGYTDPEIVSGISASFLSPAGYSEI